MLSGHSTSGVRTLSNSFILAGLIVTVGVAVVLVVDWVTLASAGVLGGAVDLAVVGVVFVCLLYTSPSPRDATLSRMPSSA